MSASLGLFRLQQVDRQLDKTQARLKEIEATLGNDARMREALATVEAAKTNQYHAERALKESEAEVKTQQIKIEQTESSLYGGKVHNPKELQDLQKDVVSLKKHLSSLEERELETMQSLDDAKSALVGAESALGTLQATLGGEHSKLLNEQASLMKDTERLTSERDAVVVQVEKEKLEKYSVLRSGKRGVAVAQILEMACAACGSDINAAIQQTARSNSQLAYCPSCGRILYAD